MRPRRIAPTEMSILRYVLEHEPVTARQVADAMADSKGFARTTTHTLLERLLKKEYISRHSEEGVFRYTMGPGKDGLMKELVGEFVDNALGGSLSPFVAFLTERANLSEAEVAELNRLLDRIEDEK